MLHLNCDMKSPEQNLILFAILHKYRAFANKFIKFLIITSVKPFTRLNIDRTQYIPTIKFGLSTKKHYSINHVVRGEK